MRPYLVLASFFSLAAAAKCATPLALTLVPTTVPPGGTAQLQFFLAPAQTITNGSVTVTLEPAIFGSILAADVYSATGDQVGGANIQGTVEIGFSSQTGGIGRTPALPVFTVTVPVLSTAQPGASSIPTLAAGALWTDTQDVQYSLTLASGAITVGGSISVSAVAPLGNILPAGAVIAISGTGFSNAATVQVDDAAISATQFIGPQQVNVILAAPANLEFHRVTVQDGGTSVSFFPVLHGSFIAVQPIFPLQLYSAATLSVGAYYQSANIALQNPTQAPIDVVIFGDGGHEPVANPKTVTIAPQSTLLQPIGDDTVGQSYALPASPLRIMTVAVNAYYGFGNAATGYTAQPATIPVPQVAVSPTAVAWNSSVGGTQPAPIPLTIQSYFPATYTASVSTSTGGPWLSVLPAQGSACVAIEIGYCEGSTIASADASKLGPGTYLGAITFVLQGANAQATVVPAVLNVFSTPQILFNPDFLQVGVVSPAQNPYSLIRQVSSTADPVAFTAAAITKSGQPWLSVSPARGQTPATLTVTVTPSALSAAADVGTLKIAGPNNTITSTAAVTLQPSQPTTIAVSPGSLQFTAFSNQVPPPSQSIDTGGVPSPFSVSLQTQSGGNWLFVVKASTSLVVTVNSTGLSPGTYQGTVNLSSTQAAQPLGVPVTLTVVAGDPPPIVVSPTTFSFTVPHGSAVPEQIISVSTSIPTGTLPIPFGVSFKPAGGYPNWIYALAAAPAITPGAISLYLDGTNLAPGVYTGSITIAAPSNSTNSVTIPIALTVTPGPPPPSTTGTLPLVAAVLNGASQSQQSLSPGEILTIFGQNFGPYTPAGAILASSTRVAATNNNVQVLFDGVAAPLLFVSSTQIDAVVPYEVNGPVTSIAVQYNGAIVTAGSYPVAPATPAIFTQNATGQGAASVLNQDNSVNTPANPATRGSVIQIYATGAGATQPPGVTGEVIGADTKIPSLPVFLSIGGAPATVTYAGSSPGEVAGLIQINAKVPDSLSPGSAVPIVLTIGTSQSQTGTTIAIK